MKNSLFILGSFADDSQGVPATIQGLAGVSIERDLYLGVRSAKLRATTFANTKSRLALGDSQFTFRHENSPAPKACANEMAPVPTIPPLNMTVRTEQQAPFSIHLRGKLSPHWVVGFPRTAMRQPTPDTI